MRCNCLVHLVKSSVRLVQFGVEAWSSVGSFVNPAGVWQPSFRCHSASKVPRSVAYIPPSLLSLSHVATPWCVEAVNAVPACLAPGMMLDRDLE
jgi:hypothetical protein